MPSHYLNYMLGALSFGLFVAFVASTTEKQELLQANLAMSSQLVDAKDKVNTLREKYAVEVRAREFAEAARDIAEVAEKDARGEVAALKASLDETSALKKSAEIALIGTQELVSDLLSGPTAASARPSSPAPLDATKAERDAPAQATPLAISETAKPSEASMPVGVLLLLGALGALAFGVTRIGRLVR
ncbi:hypothetical protein KKP04_11005 [Rhodomicrobium sp. Az07]|uniref:hypothetical protein n=1 Tax=Rhodomicrobium sp. Az07 TaxID=2839034 RepID=UPI001BE54098|nr:hypothetical protein [Rhodomicrobium sp. Az07]MBT3071391.1 hypothetical protein [Rhodomicrobium sp. Az07]